MEQQLSLMRVGRLLFILVVGYWTLAILFKDPRWIFLDNANFLFHEAGHLIFGFGGRILSLLGGTLMQLIVPALVLASFWRESNWYGVGFAVWWLGENLIKISVYMSDASERLLPLFGNGEHDWYAIFTQLGLLRHDHILGGIVFVSGVLVMIAGIGLMIFSAVKRE